MGDVDIDKRFLSTEEFIGGWIGGIGGLLASHPIDTIKVRHQNSSSTIFRAITDTYKYEGFRGYFKGIGFPAMMAGVQNAIFFGAYANVLRISKQNCDVKYETPNMEVLRIIMAGNVAGFFQVLATTPVEMIKIRLQTRAESQELGGTKNPHATILKNVQYIYSMHGIRGFYHGFIPTAFRDVPSGGFYIGIYIYTDKFLQQYINGYWSHLLSGGLAGSLSYAPLTPFDVVKTRLQADNPESPKYKNVRDCIIQSYRTDGFACFWRGFAPSCLRAFVANATVFVIYEIIVDALS